MNLLNFMPNTNGMVTPHQQSPLMNMMLQQQQPTQNPAIPTPHVPQNVPRGTSVNQVSDVSNAFGNDSEQVSNPLTKGSLEAFRNIKAASEMDKNERHRALGLALSHIGAQLGNPQHLSALGAINAGMPSAIDAYANERNRVEEFNARLLNKIRQQEMLERHRQEELRIRQQQHQDMMDYRNKSLSRPSSGRASNPYYGMTTLGKLMRQQYEIKEGYLPGSNGEVQLTPEEQKEYLDRNKLAILKIGSDSQTRNRALFAKNVELTIDSTNVDDLVRYSGPKGQAELKAQEALDLVGESSDDYKKYQEALTAVKLEAKEIRQFLGASITPEMAKELDELTNPVAISKSPEVAKRKILKVRDTIKKQLKTYQTALKSSKPYESENYSEKSNSPIPATTVSPERYELAIQNGFTPEEIEQLEREESGE